MVFPLDPFISDGYTCMGKIKGANLASNVPVEISNASRMRLFSASKSDRRSIMDAKTRVVGLYRKNGEGIVRRPLIRVLGDFFSRVRVAVRNLSGFISDTNGFVKTVTLCLLGYG